MSVIEINERIRCIEASDNPLSADIGIISGDGPAWLYDVGNGAQNIAGLNDCYNVVLSHFHQDHTGNTGRIQTREVYVSKETYRYVKKGTIVTGDLYFGSLHIFPIPSSHSKGSLGLEVDGTYAFVGDALYSRVRDGFFIYNATLLKDEIALLKKLNAPFLLVSHHTGLIRSKEEVIEELEEIYSTREKNAPEIRVKSQHTGK